MAGLLLELRRRIDATFGRRTYGTPHKGSPVKEFSKMTTQGKKDKREDSQNIQDGDVQERTVGAMSREDFLLNQIDEFRERAKQLQSLLDTKESEAQDLQTMMNERQEKAAQLEEILKDREEQAGIMTAEVEKHIDSLIAKVTAKMDEIENSMRENAEDGKRLNEAQARELKESLEQITEQLTTVKTELSDKVHTENVKCYRNISELFKNMEEKLNGMSGLEKNLNMVKGCAVAAMLVSILNFIVMMVMMVVSLGSLV